MQTDLEKWLAGEGEKFLKRLGFKEGQTILDFGCGSGHYTIPAARVVGKEGKAYALEKDSEALDTLSRLAKSQGLENIILLKTLEELKIDLNNESVDAILFYDVLHYMNAKERREIYEKVYKMLKRDGFLSVYPKHNKSDEPSWNFSDMKLEDIIKEIESANFKLESKYFEKLLHDDNYNKGFVLNFTPLNKK